jgi:molybdopterin/thiamine biosynthesis adenylyltransferase
MSPVDDTTTSRVSVSLDDENDRYHRPSLISWWEQSRLRAARVLVVGAGAIGNELVKNLALAGIGTVVVIDLDHVENSNLSRCIFFRPEDEGRPKAEVVCERAAAVNTDVRFIPLVGDVRHALGLGDFADFDVVLGGLDNREARLHVNQACWKTTTPWVDGAIEGLMGTMRVFVPPESACYECTMSPRDHELLALRRACTMLDRDEMLEGKVPTTGTSGSVIAALQVQELIKLLHADRIPGSFAGQGVAFNGMTHDSYVVSYPRQDMCLSHDTYELGDAERRSADEPLSAVLQRGRELLGAADAVLELECDIVLSASCVACDCTDVINRPVTKVRMGQARCPECGEDRRLDARHMLEQPEHLSLSAADLALPENDVVTVRNGMERVHFLVGDALTRTDNGDRT